MISRVIRIKKICLHLNSPEPVDDLAEYVTYGRI